MQEKKASEALLAAVREARSLRTKLDSLDDQVSAVLQKIEAELRDLSLGVAIRTNVGGYFDPNCGFEQVEVLSFEKLAGEWRLVFGSGVEDQENLWTDTPLSDCNRDLRARMLAMGHVADLVLGAARAMEERIGDRKRALQSGASVLLALSEVGADK